MDRLEVGMEVEILSHGTIGVVAEVFNSGSMGRVRSPNGADYTVFREECIPANLPMDKLDRMFCEAIGLVPGREQHRVTKPSWRPLCEKQS